MGVYVDRAALFFLKIRKISFLGRLCFQAYENCPEVLLLLLQELEMGTGRNRDGGLFLLLRVIF
jgi:hypothetical protein